MWFEIVFTHRRSRDSRRTFGSEQTTRSLETHTQDQSVIEVVNDIFKQPYTLDSGVNHNADEY